MELTTQLDLSLNMAESSTLDFGSPTSRVAYSKSISLATGTGLNQADLRWSDQRTLTQNTNEDIDVVGALTGALGTTLSLAKLKMIVLYSLSTNVVNLTISRPATNGVPFLAAASDAFVLVPGGLFVFVNPSLAAVTCTAGTADLINIAAAAGAADAVYDIHIVGTSA